MDDRQPIDPAIERSAVRKASWRILPLLGLGYLVSTIDRFNISFAATRMNADLGFSATVYGFGAGLFFLSYALFEIPSGMLVARTGPRRWLARIMISWGLVAAGMMFVRTAGQFYVMRFLLGMAEAGFFPSALYCVAHWFPPGHRGRATSLFYASGGVASIIMGALSGWLLDLDGLAGLHGWQWLFVVEGLPAILLGFVVLRFLPDMPARARWLTGPERDWIEGELAREAARLGKSADRPVLDALRDPRVLWLALIGCLTIGSYVSFQLFQPMLLSDATGLDTKHVGYLVSASGVVLIVGMLATGWHSDRLGQRFTHLVASTSLVGASYLVMGLAASPAALLVAYFAMSFCWPAVTLSTNLLCTEVVPRRLVGVSVGAVNTLAQLGAFVGPWLWGIGKDATGTHHLGLMGLPVAFWAAAAVAWNLKRQLAAKAPSVDEGALAIG